MLSHTKTAAPSALSTCSVVCVVFIVYAIRQFRETTPCDLGALADGRGGGGRVRSDCRGRSVPRPCLPPTHSTHGTQSHAHARRAARAYTAEQKRVARNGSATDWARPAQSVILQLGGLFRDEDANVRAAASTALAKLGGAGRRYRRPLRHATCGGHHATCNATYSASLERRRLDVDGSDTQVLTHTLRYAHNAHPNTCMPKACMPKVCMRHATCGMQHAACNMRHATCNMPNTRIASATLH